MFNKMKKIQLLLKTICLMKIIIFSLKQMKVETKLLKF